MAEFRFWLILLRLCHQDARVPAKILKKSTKICGITTKCKRTTLVCKYLKIFEKKYKSKLYKKYFKLKMKHIWHKVILILEEPKRKVCLASLEF